MNETIIPQRSELHIHWIDPDTGDCLLARVVAWRISGSDAEPITWPSRPRPDAIAGRWLGMAWHACGRSAYSAEHLAELILHGGPPSPHEHAIAYRSTHRQ